MVTLDVRIIATMDGGTELDRLSDGTMALCLQEHYVVCGKTVTAVQMSTMRHHEVLLHVQVHKSQAGKLEGQRWILTWDRCGIYATAVTEGR